MTTLIPKFDLKNGGSTPTGAINRAINLKLAETVSVEDFGAVGDGTTNDTAAIQAAIDATRDGGTLLINNIYLVTGLTITKRIDIIGNNTGGDGAGLTGSGFKSVTNATILNYSTTASRFSSLQNINILGSRTAGNNQYGIAVNNAGLRVQNCTIRDCGGSGMYVTNSYAGSYANIYISHCKYDGVTISTNAGANVWQDVVCAANDVHGFNLFTMDGADTFIGCVSEQNLGYGLYFGNNVVGNNFHYGYTEQNTLGTLLFASGSDYNAVHFNSYSDSTSEPLPVNNGGTGNTVSGKRYLEPTRYRFAKFVGIGDVGISPQTVLDVASAENNVNIATITNKGATNPNGVAIVYSNVTGGAGGAFLDCADNARRLIILGNGNVQNVTGSYTAISDLKLKENIVDATPKLDDLMKVRVVNYGLKTEPNSKYLGVVAQELETIFPGLIEEIKDTEKQLVVDENGNEKYELVETGETTKSVKYSIFVPMLIKALQEMQTQIDELKGKQNA